MRKFAHKQTENKQTNRQRTENSKTEATLILCGSSGERANININKWQGPALVARSGGSKNVTYRQQTTLKRI